MAGHEVARRSGALYVKPGSRALIAAPYTQRAALMALIKRQEDRGLVRRLGRTAQWSHAAQRWEIPVQYLKPAPPAWRRPALITAAVVLPVSGVVGLIWWALHTLAATIGLAALAGVLVLFVAGLLGGVGRRGADVTVQTITTTRVRVR